jgi:hypothetical protein
MMAHASADPDGKPQPLTVAKNAPSGRIDEARA